MLRRLSLSFALCNNITGLNSLPIPEISLNHIQSERRNYCSCHYLCFRINKLCQKDISLNICSYIILKVEINQDRHCFALLVSNSMKRSTISVASPQGGYEGAIVSPKFVERWSSRFLSNRREMAGHWFGKNFSEKCSQDFSFSTGEKRIFMDF